MARIADIRCEICRDLSAWNSEGWTWIQGEKRWWHKFCPACVQKVHTSLQVLPAYKWRAKDDPMADRMLKRRLVDISGIADGMDEFTKRRRLREAVQADNREGLRLACMHDDRQGSRGQTAVGPNA